MAPRVETPSPRFESLAFQVEVKRGERPLAIARAALRAALGAKGWSVQVLNARTHEFEAVRTTGRAPTVAAAWDAAYRLRQDPRIVYVEPLFEIPNEEQFAVPTGAAALALGDDNDPGTATDFEWSLKSMKVPQAWALFDTTTPGAGVVVGHPDTGYTPHPEIIGTRLRIADGFDFEDDKSDPRDPLAGGFLRNPGHGTSTSSVIMSGQGLPAGAPGPAFVSGTAPGAALIPIRTTKSVVLFSMRNLTKAILHAVEQGAHVISISLGGPVPSTAIHNAVREAETRGVIVLCAAGNQVRFVVFPAAFDEVLAVAASRIDDTPWPGSCRGPAVDITAPGSSVWRARTEKNGAAEDFSVARGSGTSFAVAATAGLAALWLAFHGRTALIARYGRDRLTSVFKQVLRDSCRTPPGWDTADFGPGIADARALLLADLPVLATAIGARSIRRRAVSDDRASLEVLVHQLAPAPRSGVARAVADLLHVDETALPDALDDVGAELAMRVGTDPTLRRQLREAAESFTQQGVRATVRPVGAARRRAALIGGSRRMRTYLAPPRASRRPGAR